VEDLAPWRIALPAVVALACAWYVEVACARRGLLPPGFADPLRRWFARLALAGVLWLGVFQTLAMIGVGVEPDLVGVPTPRLFLLHVVLIVSLLLWMLAGYAGIAGRAVRPVGPGPLPPGSPEGPGSAAPAADPEPALGDTVEPLGVPPAGAALSADPAGAAPVYAEAAPPRVSLARRIAVQLGLVAPSIGREIGLGLLLGIGAWAAVLLVVVLIALALLALGAQDFLPKGPSPLIPFMAGLPFAVRSLLSLSAGVVEETFFRGFLQPRVGIFLSTLLFVLAHASYGQPFMLVTIALLSLAFAWIVRWRQNIWPAIAAHVLFDAVQLLILVPQILKLIGPEGKVGGGVAAALGIG
jgi:membrane protease YdiL (CAAX protease family)